MKALIFGATGQDGLYLRTVLESDGITVNGASRYGSDWQVDVGDRVGVFDIIKKVSPDFVFHLAADSSTSRESLWNNHSAISTGSLAILDAVEQLKPSARVLLVGSGLQFVNTGIPLDERAALDHSSPYSVARNHSLFAGRYFRARGLNVYFAWLFNHDSPFRSARHLNMKIALAAANAKRGSDEPLRIGNLDAMKEFGFAGDIAAALWTLVQQEREFEVVVGTGKAHSIRDWIEACYKIVDLPWEKFIEPMPEYHSPYHQLYSNPSTMLSLGWKPRMGFSDLAQSMMTEAQRQVDARHQLGLR